MISFLLNKTFTEHHQYPNGEDVTLCFEELPLSIRFQNNVDEFCVEFVQKDASRFLRTSYYIGVDWIIPGELPIYVAPKLNKAQIQIDYLQLLFNALQHPEVIDHTDDLYEIKFDAPYIEIQQQQDFLTPLLVLQFLRIVRTIARKGLKRSYYRVEQNLKNKIKGKIQVGKTIKENIMKNRVWNTVCEFDEFGVNGIENRLLKKALVFVQKYIAGMRWQHSTRYFEEMLNYIRPVFEEVSADIQIQDIKHYKANPFYREYAEAIRLAKLILQLFGYNIANTQHHERIKLPPFWINMAKLFELHVLGLLKERFGRGIVYHPRFNKNEPDYLLNEGACKMVIDAKYRPLYVSKNGYDMENIRQISGYARLLAIYGQLNIPNNEVIDCLIIYPDQQCDNLTLMEVDVKDPKYKMDQFTGFYKIPVRLPVINSIQ